MRVVHEFVALVHAFAVFVTVLLWAVPTNEPNPGRMMQNFILLLPLSIICLALWNVGTRARIAGYLIVGFVMLPMTLVGLFAGWGIMYGLGFLTIYVALYSEWEGSKTEEERRADRWRRKYKMPSNGLGE